MLASEFTTNVTRRAIGKDGCCPQKLETGVHRDDTVTGTAGRWSVAVLEVGSSAPNTPRMQKMY